MTWVHKRGALPLGNTNEFHRNIDYVANWETTDTFVKDFRQSLKSTLSTRPKERKRSSKSVTFGEERKYSIPQRHSLSAKSDGNVRLSDVLNGIDNMTVNRTPSDWVAQVMDYQRQPPNNHSKHSIYCEVLGNKNCSNCPNSQKHLAIQNQRHNWTFPGFHMEDRIGLNMGLRSKTFAGPLMREVSWASTITGPDSDDIADMNSERDEASTLKDDKAKESVTLPNIHRSYTNMTDHELHMRVMRSKSGHSRKQNCISTDSTYNRCRYNTNQVNIKFTIKK